MNSPLFTRYRPPAQNQQGIPIVGDDDIGSDTTYGQNNDDGSDEDYTGGSLYGPPSAQAPPSPPSPSAPLTGGAPSVAANAPPPPPAALANSAPPSPIAPPQSPYSPTRAIMDKIQATPKPVLKQPSIWRQLAATLGETALGAITGGRKQGQEMASQVGQDIRYGPTAINEQQQYAATAADLQNRLNEAKEAEATEGQAEERRSKALDNAAKANNAPLVAGNLAAEAALKTAQAHNLETQDKFITTKDGSIYDTTKGTFVVQPSDKHPGMLKVDPAIGSQLGLVQEGDGTYYAPAAHYNELIETLKKIQSGEGGPKPDDKERFIQQYLKENNLADSATTRMKANKAYAESNQPDQRPPLAGEGTWTLQEQNGKSVLFNTKTGETKAAPEGLAKSGTAAKAEAADAPTKAALTYATDYLNSGAFTGAGDEALQEKFFELAKPSTGFRMTQPQMQMLKDSASWMNSIRGKLYHATTGTWFPDQQRKEIVDTMNNLAKSKGIGGNAPDGGKIVVTAPDGSTHPFDTQAQADAFKKLAGIK